MRHTPKKLTDCPENLRESIDWLIQVRYGNGDGGDGLDQLSQALKKLIEEAIEKAEKSLNAEKSKLECPVKYRGNESTCQAMDRQIKDVEERLKKLEGSEDRDKGQKTASLNATKSQLEHYKNSCNANHTKYPENPALKDIDSKLSQVKNLKKSLEGLTENDNCEKLLTNLCDGLETFLGFNSESKGYDGTGIVYSDLDRLCDGVMGFLYYLLKDVSEKQPYSVGKTMLKDFVETELKPKLSTGRKGFEVIEQVAGKVREYNERVKQSNDDMKTI
ncbi:hypothetical protein, conserved [Babesia bigemina]|uniref:Uncharacterized protein n=1 Tax=Babesia bigemina TaxID=5866 RepID=A0A061BJM9_BABBI|nr:hypothetical protein, conserved [Babesia bigemina]CDR71705.1 hypothetical protein, conserved [Babesia bigemina]|eukprot:XP_012770651.1 hypothetical protein, conserved [Babesia bigemina]